MMFGGENDFDEDDVSGAANPRSEGRAIALWIAYLAVGAVLTFGVYAYHREHQPLVAEAASVPAMTDE